LSQIYTKGDNVFWWGFNSCTLNTEALKQFLVGKNKTLFNIHCHSGICIREFSAIKSEEEVLLIPGTCFRVLNSSHIGDMCLVELTEENSPWNKFPML